MRRVSPRSDGAPWKARSMWKMQFVSSHRSSCIFHIERAFQGAPSERGETRRICVSAHLALQKALQIAERRLTVLVLDQSVIGLLALDPRAKTKQVFAASQSQLVA